MYCVCILHTLQQVNKNFALASSESKRKTGRRHSALGWTRTNRLFCGLNVTLCGAERRIVLAERLPH
jgi:hypothetical protein